jgi:Mn2+/Fe2+ NRAMP family transporter
VKATLLGVSIDQRRPIDFHWRKQMRSLAISTLVLVGLAAPAMAQSSTTTTTTSGRGMSEQFYVVRDASTRRCTVTSTRPTTSTTTVVGDTVYKTRTEADTAVTKVCTN